MRLSSTIVFVVIAVVAMWALTEALGFEMALVSSLVLSVGLTLVLNLGVRAFSRR